MPRRDSKRVTPISKKTYEPFRRNAFSLLKDENLDKSFKSLKIGDATSRLELSSSGSKLTGDIFLDGNIANGKLATDNTFLELEADTYVRLAGGGGGYMDFHPLGGSSWMFFNSDNFNIVAYDALQLVNFGSIGYLGQVQFDFLNSNYKFSCNASEGGVNDWFRIGVNANGATLLETADSGGTVGHINIQPDGDLKLTPKTGITYMYDYDNSADYAKFTVGTHGDLTLETVDAASNNADLKLEIDGEIVINQASGSVTFTDDDTTYAIISNSLGAGYLRLSSTWDVGDYFYVTSGIEGGSSMGTVNNNGEYNSPLTIAPFGDLILSPYNNIIQLSDSTIGFLQTTASFDATDTVVRFDNDGNKQKLTLTNNVTDVHFRFPDMSGNFVCVILQDGTGGRTVSNWKSKDSDDNAADNDGGTAGAIRWAGGTAPANTETADKADIVSFYWDATNEIAYGTYTYNF